MSDTWNAPVICLTNEFDLRVSASAECVTTGRTNNNIYASDLKLVSTAQAREYAAAINTAADFCDAARGAK